MHLFVISLLLLTSLQAPTPSPRKNSQPKHQQAEATTQPTTSDQRGTEQSPLVVKTLKTPKTQEEIQQDAADSQRKAATDWWMVCLTGILALIAFGQLGVYYYQAKKLKETVESAEGQSKAMERHIGEAARSATAMEQIARVIQSGNKAVTRAYLTVVINRAFFQEKGGPGQPDWKWQAIPKVLNTGMTPARKIKIRISAKILPNPLPPDFDFPLQEPRAEAEQTVGAHQNAELMGGATDEVVPENEVAAIKEANGRALFVWGSIKYEDIFGDSHATKFGQMLYWLNNNVFGLYIPGQNDAD